MKNFGTIIDNFDTVTKQYVDNKVPNDEHIKGIKVDNATLADTAKKVQNVFTYKAHDKTAGTVISISYDGSEVANLDFVADDFAPVYTSGKDLGLKLVDKGYATKTYVDNQDVLKLDKAGGSVTGNLTIGGNLTVNGTTTSIDSTTLKVSDKLIEVAKDNTVKLTTPAGIVVPKYDGASYGALVIDGDGNAQVGDVKLDASGNIDVTTSDLQTLATREGLTDGNLVKWNGTKKTLVPDTTVASNASSALSKANANATEISTIKTTYQTKTDNTLGTTSKTVVGAINEVKGTADSALSKANANATEISNLKDGTTKVKKAEHADRADQLGHLLEVTISHSSGPSPASVVFDGSKVRTVLFDKDMFSSSYITQAGENVGILIKLTDTGVTAGEYTAIKVDGKGRVTAGGKAFAFIEAGAAIPEDVMIGGIVFEAKA